MEKLIQTLTEGAQWFLLMVCMLTVTALVTAGAVSLIRQPELSDLLLFIGAGCALFIQLTISGNK